MLYLLPTLLAPALSAGPTQDLLGAQDLLAGRIEDSRSFLRHPKDQGLARVVALLDE